MTALADRRVMAARWSGGWRVVQRRRKGEREEESRGEKEE